MKYSNIDMLGMEIIVAEHKGVLISLSEGDDYVCINSCGSSNEGKGEVQEALKIIKKDVLDNKIK